MPAEKKPQIELKELGPQNIQAEDLPRLPNMTGWFEPGLLLKLLGRVIVSDLFGQYADRRLMEAALDTDPKQKQIERAKLPTMSPRSDGAIWIDYVADLGDGFDGTYAIAYLLAQQNLTINGQELPRGSALFMGGDEVYPTALRDDYKIKMRLPYDLAWPAQKKKERTPLFLLPGNHDWYDGLINFLAIFCREKATAIGGWSTVQRRSYFAAEIATNWWVWGIDIALVRDLDQPQADYFVAMAKEMPEGANIILCSAEPGWYKAESKGDSYRTLSYASQIALTAKRNLRIPLVLSGDSHHYARYISEGGTHYITSGGGGAFLHGTLELKDTIDAPWLQSAKDDLSLVTCYPSKTLSTELLKGNKNFGALNKGLCRTLAAFYALCAFSLASLPRVDVGLVIAAMLVGTLWGYLRYQELSWKKTAVVALTHAAAHFAAIAGFALIGHWLIQKLHFQDLHWAAQFLTIAVPIALVGPWLAGKIYGLSLWVGCRFFDISHNDAFSSMQLDDYRQFLRIRLQGDTATVFAIKIDRVPTRAEWKMNPAHVANSEQSVFVPSYDLQPALVEQPIVIHARTSTTTSQVKTPEELPKR